MNHELKQMIDYVRSNTTEITNESVYEAVQKYFSEIVWSIEKDEWNRMSANEKKDFIRSVVTYIND